MFPRGHLGMKGFYYPGKGERGKSHEENGGNGIMEWWRLVGKNLGISSDGESSIGMDGTTNRTQGCALGMSHKPWWGLSQLQRLRRELGMFTWEGKDPGRAGARPGGIGRAHV